MVPPAGHSAGWLRAGTVGRPHGLDGSFYVSQANVALLDGVDRLRIGDTERLIERRAGTPARPIIRLQGCRDRASAAALTGLAVLVARDEAPELESDEWYAEDLEGCAVRDGGRRLGVVERLLALPSCEVLEVRRTEAGSPAAPLLVPLVKDAVREVDLERREIDVDLVFLGES